MVRSLLARAKKCALPPRRGRFNGAPCIPLVVPHVVGIERPLIMGEPVLTYAARSDAEHVVARHAGAQMLDLAGLQRWWDAREAAR